MAAAKLALTNQISLMLGNDSDETQLVLKTIYSWWNPCGSTPMEDCNHESLRNLGERVWNL